MLLKRSLCTLFLLLSLVCVAFSFTQEHGANIERGLLEAVNRSRHEQGLPRLQWDAALASAARKHATRMAESRSLSHQFSGEISLPARVGQAGVRHSWLSENVAEGMSVNDLHEQFMKSPNHRANILDSDMDTIGIGVVESGGKWFAVEDFCKAK